MNERAADPLADAPTAHAVLRARTAPAHEAVDAAFGRFDLGDADSYRDFLLAQARVLAPLETLLRACPALPAWRERASMLAADLTALGAAMPPPAAAGGGWGEAELHGLLYVLEGSRLGGKLLARKVPPDLPSAFLGAGHEKGEWRAFLAALNERAAARGGVWLDRAAAGALAGFRFYEEAGRAGA